MQTHGLAALTSEHIALLRNGLRIMALRALGDEDTAEDVAQESLLRALDAVSQEIAKDPVRLGAFVGGIARHVIADVRRREARLASLPEAQPDRTGATSLDTVVKAEDRTRVVRALERLPAADQVLLRASFYEGLTPGQIAFRTQEASEVVRKRKSRALVKLRRIFENPGHAAPPAASKDVVWAPAAGESE